MKGKKKPKAKIAGVEIDRVSLAEIVPATYNPRRIDDAALEGLARSVEEFGYVEPLVINKRTGRLISGHQRLKVLARQGVEEVDVVIVDLDEAREKALNITMNSQTVAGEWDGPALADILGELREHDALEGLFGGLRMDALLEDLDHENLNSFGKPDLDKQISKLPEKTKEDGNWFYVEFYGQDDLFAELSGILKDMLKTKHEINPEAFMKMVKNLK